MTDSRYNVLAAITRQIRIGHPPPASSFDHPGPAALPPRPVDRESLVAGFTRELETLTGIVYRVRDEGAAADIVIDLLSGRGVRRVLTWDPEWLNAPGLTAALVGHEIALESCWLPATPRERAARLQELDDVGVGLTGATAALADSGSLVMVSGPGRGRIASLLPPTHVAIVRAEDIYPSLPHYLAGSPDVTDQGSNLVVITGP